MLIGIETRDVRAKQRNGKWGYNTGSNIAGVLPAAGKRSETSVQGVCVMQWAIQRSVTMRLSVKSLLSLVVALLLLSWGSAQAAITIATVTVGDPGNLGDFGGDAGAVAYNYDIGKYEVTAGQYTAFLNAVAATDTYGLYNPAMVTAAQGCKIQRSGSPGSYTYSVAADYANRPVNEVSWGDAARFSNWMYNGQPTGPQSLSTTEDGSYYINGANTDAALMAVTRKTNATWAIANDHEWYKAAFYLGAAADSYSDYPTQAVGGNYPGRDLTEATKPGNNANYYGNGIPYPIDGIYYTTTVGQFYLSDSYYGTFDQGGNVYEWNEAYQQEQFVGPIVNRGARGGGWGSSDYHVMSSGWQSYSFVPTTERSDFGFRMVNYTGPSPLVNVTWTGNSSTAWDTGAGSDNWKNSGDNTPADYANSVAVTFDDTAVTTTADISTEDIAPTGVLFNNSSLDFTITGTHGIGGNGGVVKQGTGTVTMNSVNFYYGATFVKQGTLRLGTAAQDPVFTGPGGADVWGGKLVLDYSGTAPDVLTILSAGYAQTPKFSDGRIRDTMSGATGLLLGWKDDTANQQVTVMATLAGDANLDGSVTGADLSLLLSKYNQAGNWAVGDFNYDGSVTGADLSLLLSKYNQSVPASVAGAAVAGVPEPSSLVMLAALAAAMGLGVAGRRRFAARALLRTFRVSILKEVAMKRLLILGVCIVMSSALTARASVMPFGTFIKGGESVAVDYTRTAQTGALAGLDLVILSVDSINGAGSSSINGMVSAGVGNPTFTGLNGSYMYICDPGAVYITNAFPANFTAPGSYVNFDSVSGAFAGTLKSSAPAYAATLGAVHGYSEWSASLFTTGAGIGVGGTLAGIYVPNNGNFQLVGGLSLQDGNVLTGSGMTTSDIPEPTTLALLATGLFGLLAYAWRKRK